MPAPIIDFAAAFKTAIAAGQTVQEGNVIKIVADTGAEIGNATFKVINGGNGVATKVTALTTSAAGGTATTSGVAIMAMELPTVCAALAPCFGIVAGLGLYNLAPDFFTNLSNELFINDKTIGGKILTFFDGDNIFFDEETIEIVKNALLDTGIFNELYQPPAIDVDEMLVTWGDMTLKECKDICIAFVNGRPGVEDEHKADAITYIRNSDSFMWVQHYYYKDDPENKYSLNIWSDTNTGGDQYPISTDQITHETYITDIGQRLMRWQKGGYYGDSDNFPFDMENPYYISLWDRLTETSGRDVCLPRFGNLEENEQTQPASIFPTRNVFTSTYPEWFPKTFPDTLPGMPTIYPVKYPGTLPEPYPQQLPAQNPDPEDEEETYPALIPYLPLPHPVVTPEVPEVDPETGVTPDPTDDTDPSAPSDNPEDPNEHGTPSGNIPVPVLPSSVSSTKLFTVYNPNETQLNSLGAYLWDNSIMEMIKKIWQNPLDGIISLIQIYATPTTSGSHNIILGFLDSEVSAPVVSSQFVTVPCGSVSIPELKKNATDYAPFVSLHVYLPFIGIVELDVNEFMNGTMTIQYKVDVYTGTCIAEIFSTRTTDMPYGNKVYEFSGNCAQQIPLTSGDASGLMGALISGAGLALSVASGGSLSVLGAATAAGHSLTHEMMHTSRSGNLTSNAGILGNRKPFVIISRRQSYDAARYNEMYGFPSNATVYLSNCTGYARVKDIKLRTTATDPERQEILEMLHNGIYV